MRWWAAMSMAMSSCCSAVTSTVTSAVTSAVTSPGCSRRRWPRSARRSRKASSDMITATRRHRHPGMSHSPALRGATAALQSPLPPVPCCHFYVPVPCCPLAPGLPHPLLGPHILPCHPTHAGLLCPMSPQIVTSGSPSSPFPRVLPPRFPLLHVPSFPSGHPCVALSPVPPFPCRCPHVTALTVLPHAHVQALLEATGLALPPLGLGDGAAPGEGAGEADALVDGAPGGT